MDIEALQQPARLKITNVFEGPLRHAYARRGPRDCPRWVPASVNKAETGCCAEFGTKQWWVRIGWA
jgi:hypothetical protein